MLLSACSSIQSIVSYQFQESLFTSTETHVSCMGGDQSDTQENNGAFWPIVITIQLHANFGSPLPRLQKQIENPDKTTQLCKVNLPI